MKRSGVFFNLLLIVVAGQLLGAPAAASPMKEAERRYVKISAGEVLVGATLDRQAASGGLTFAGATASAAEAAAEHLQQEVAIPAGEVALAATLYRPGRQTGPVPAVVLGHGSGPVTRDVNKFWINTALRTGGLAVLVFDKRGSGRCTGKFEKWSVETTPKMFSNLASDMENAVRWLAKQPGIDRDRIGLMGGSQAGWIMPLAASREPLVKFVVVGEGVPLPAGIEDIHSTYLNAVAPYGKTRPTLRQIAAADELAMDYVGEKGFDPSPVLENLKIPVLWMFGLYDEATPTRLSIHAIGELQRAGRTNHHIHVFAFADHNF